MNDAARGLRSLLKSAPITWSAADWKNLRSWVATLCAAAESACCEGKTAKEWKELLALSQANVRSEMVRVDEAEQNVADLEKYIEQNHTCNWNKIQVECPSLNETWDDSLVTRIIKAIQERDLLRSRCEAMEKVCKMAEKATCICEDEVRCHGCWGYDLLQALSELKKLDSPTPPSPSASAYSANSRNASSASEPSDTPRR